MRLTTRTRYGARLLFELANNYGHGLVLLKDISRRQNISEKYLSKIIILLKSAGLVKSERGSKGGYILAKSPDKINMLEVVEVLEGGILFIDCINSKKDCAFQNKCPTYDLWSKLADVTYNFLKSKTLKDIVVDYQRKKGEYSEIYYI